MRMELSRLDPFRDFAELQQGVNSIFNQFRDRSSGQDAAGAAVWEPICDVSESDYDIRVMFEIPGMSLDDISLEVTADSLTVQGERQREQQEGTRWVRLERPAGRFSRTFSIHVPIDVANVRATYKDGLLTVTIPKSDELKPKRISVEAG